MLVCCLKLLQLGRSFYERFLLLKMRVANRLCGLCRERLRIIQNELPEPSFQPAINSRSTKLAVAKHLRELAQPSSSSADLVLYQPRQLQSLPGGSQPTLSVWSTLSLGLIRLKPTCCLTERISVA